MSAVFQLSEGKERFLVAPYELLALLPPRQNFNEEKLYRTLLSNSTAISSSSKAIERESPCSSFICGKRGVPSAGATL